MEKGKEVWGRILLSLLEVSVTDRLANIGISALFNRTLTCEQQVQWQLHLHCPETTLMHKAYAQSDQLLRLTVRVEYVPEAINACQL